MTPTRLALLASGSGRTLRNFLDRIADGSLAARMELVIVSRADAYAKVRAETARVPVVVVSPGGDMSERITGEIDRVAPDLVLMAGFLYLWRFPARYAGRVMNIHPALLPKFGGAGMYGRRVHEAVLAAGEKESGCTVHFADLEYDHGPLILQRRVPVLPDDTPETLAERVFAEECIAYPEAVRRFAEVNLPGRGA